MRKATALLLAVLMLASVLTGCTTLVGEDKGAVIDLYIATEVYNFDPQVSDSDSAMLKVNSLCYEGLTRLDKNGKWQYALMKRYEIDKDNENEFSILIYLKNSWWTDGRSVQAADFVYSWKRLLNVNSKYEAASLLYDLKNAYDIKMGDASIDDLGVAAVDTYTIQVKFERKVDLDEFFTKCSSLALVPLREDVISRYGEEDWAKKGTNIITNGPFTPKTINYPNLLRLERSPYYYLDREKNNPLDKYVIPYRLMTTYSRGDLGDQLEAYENGEIFYLGEIPLSDRERLKGQAVITDMMSTHTYVFNTENELFSDPDVRRALSLAIDRDEIVSIVTYAKAAEGLIPYGAFDTGRSTSFRKEGGSLIESSADISAARQLLSSAGVNGGKFTLTVRDKEEDVAVAEYVASVWKSLGFDVKVDRISPELNESDTDIYDDLFQEVYDAGDFDVIAVDLSMCSPYPFQALAQFAESFSGNGVDMYSENYDLYPHISGYNSEDYNSLIMDAFVETDASVKAGILHEAEKMLIEDMPVIPLYYHQNAYLASKELSGFSTDYYGIVNFNRVQQKDYMKYKDAETEK